MSQGLSVLARLIRKGTFAEFQQGVAAARVDPKMPALPGFTRGTLGSTGSRFGPKTRNSDAQDDQDRQMIGSPIMRAFLQRTAGV
jgi:hypothetical protein